MLTASWNLNFHVLRCKRLNDFLCEKKELRLILKFMYDVHSMGLGAEAVVFARLC